MDTFKAFLNGTTAPLQATVTIADLKFSLLSAPAASSPVNTVVGTLAATVQGGSLVNQVWTLPNTAGGDFKLVGTQVQIAVGNLPAGSYTIRARLVADNAAAREEDFTVTVSAAVAAEPIGTGAGGYAGLAIDKGANFRWGYGAAETLSVPFEFKALNAIGVGTVLQVDHDFGLGDVPNGWRFFGKLANGTTFPIHSDLINTTKVSGASFQKYVSLSWASPVAVAAGAVAAFTIHTEAVAPDNAGHKTAAQIAAALDLIWEASGIDLPAAMQVSLRDIITNNPETLPGAGYGVNPAQGWRYEKRNPSLVDVHAWGFFKRASDGALDAFRRLDMWVEARPDGTYRVGAEISQPNVYGPHPSGTVGVRDDQVGIVSEVRLKNGSTVIRQWGGTDGVDAFTVDASAFNVGNKSLNLPAGVLMADHTADCVPVTFSGSGTPSGLANIPGGVAWISAPYGGREIRFSTIRGRANDGDLMPLGTLGTGSCRVMPAIATFPACSPWLLDSDARRIWIGAGEQPKILPNFDVTYITRRAAGFQDFPLPGDESEHTAGGGGGPMPNQTVPKYVPCTVWDYHRDEREQGDDFLRGGTYAVDRLGPLPWTHCNLVVYPYDEASDQRARVQAAQFSCAPKTLRDERGGRTPVFINGPDNSGAQFPGLGPNNPTLEYLINDGQFGNPVQKLSTIWLHSGLIGDNPVGRGSGAGLGYNRLADGSHLPQFFRVPGMRTGDPMYRHKMIDLAMACHGSTHGEFTRDGVTYYGICDFGGRGGAWQLMRLLEADTTVPDAWPESKFIQQCMFNTGEWMADRAARGDQRHLGIMQWVEGVGYTGGFYHGALASVVRLGKYPSYVAAVECTSRWQFGLFDDEGHLAAGADQGLENGGAMLSRSGNLVGSASFTNLAQILTNDKPGPYPARATGQYGGAANAGNQNAWVNDYNTYWFASATRYVNLRRLGLAFLPDKIERIRAQSLERMTSGGNGFPHPVGGERNRVKLLTLPAANVQLKAEAYAVPPVTGSITGPSAPATVGQSASFTVAASDFPVWKFLKAGNTIVGTPVAVNGPGATYLTPNAAVSQVACLSSDAAGETVIAATASFTPASPPPPPTGDGAPGETSSLYTFEHGPNQVYNGWPLRNSPVGNGFKFRCYIDTKAGGPNGQRPNGDVVFIAAPAGTNPSAVGGEAVKVASYYGNEGRNEFYSQDGWNFLNYDFELWVRTADGHYSKDPGGVYVRYA